MKLNEPTVAWPTDPTKLYIHALYHEFFWGPYDSVEDVTSAKVRMTAIDPYWNYDCTCVYRGDSTEATKRTLENLVPAN